MFSLWLLHHLSVSVYLYCIGVRSLSLFGSALQTDAMMGWETSNRIPKRKRRRLKPFRHFHHEITAKVENFHRSYLAQQLKDKDEFTPRNLPTFQGGSLIYMYVYFSRGARLGGWVFCLYVHVFRGFQGPLGTLWFLGMLQTLLMQVI
jgi:hypothetical protein